VIKAPITGSIMQLRRVCLNYDLDTVFSSVFETSIGRGMSLSLAQELANPERALGYNQGL
jgi:O-succinylbenzoate synthase